MLCDELMKYSPSGRDQSLVCGSGSASARLVGAAKYAVNSPKVIEGEPAAESFCVDVECEGWKTREVQSAEATPCVDSRKARKAETGRVSRLVSAEKMLRSSERMMGEVSLRGWDLASRLATPAPARWGAAVAIEEGSDEEGEVGYGGKWRRWTAWRVDL